MHDAKNRRWIQTDDFTQLGLNYFLSQKKLTVCEKNAIKSADGLAIKKINFISKHGAEICNTIDVI